MSTQELHDYIHNELKSGKSRPEIVKALLANGWQQADVDLAFVTISRGVPLPSQAAQNGLKPFGELFWESWAILKHRLWSFLAIAVIPSAIVFAGSMIIAVVTSTTAIVTNPASMVTRSDELFTAFSIAWVVVFIVSMVITIICNLALYYLAAHWAEPVGFREAYAYALKKFGNGLWVQVLVGAAIYGGLVLFFVPGVIASVALAFAMAVFVAEGTGGFEALLRSHAYVSKRWWAIWWRMFLLGLVAGGIALVLWLPAIFTLGLIWSVFFLLWQVFAIIFTFQLYQNAKATATQPTSPNKKTQYLVYVIIGAIVIIGALAALAIGLAVGLNAEPININLNINTTT